jgi:hypothetical protein
LSDEEVYAGFSPKTMEIIKTDEAIPANFKIGKNNEIIELSPMEQIEAGLVSVEALLQRYVGDAQSLKTSMEELLANKLINTVAQGQAMLDALAKAVEQRISQAYNTSYELKIAKDFMTWLEDGQPPNDRREARYREMQAYIDGVKGEFSAIKEQVRQLVANLSEGTPSEAKGETSGLPDASWTKAQLTEYMDARNISYTTRDTKETLLEKIKAASPS